MNPATRGFFWRASGYIATSALLIALGLGAVLWWKELSQIVDRTLGRPIDGAADGHAEASASHHGGSFDTAHHDHSTIQSIELSAQARNNLGLTKDAIRPVELSTYRRTLDVPAVIVPRPGRTQIQVSSPFNGVVTHVHSVTGEAVVSGDLLFEVRLSYEDLVESQTAYLKSLGELEVENREIERLEAVTQSGAVSGKTLLERRYAKDKLEALIRSQREGLKLHGLSDRQVDAIASEGKMLRELQIVAPEVDDHPEKEELRLSRIEAHSIGYRAESQGAGSGHQDSANASESKLEAEHAHAHPKNELRAPESSKPPLIIEELRVEKGQAVTAGEQLCSVADYQKLFIEGQAFEQDSAAIAQAARRGWTVEAVFHGLDQEEIIEGLKVVFVGNAVDVASRTLSFYVELPNKILRDETNAEGQRFVSWKYRTGQRLQIRVPVEEWKDQIVLPVEAVVKEGAEWFVFQQNGSRFDRIAVHLTHRDQSFVVIANDGSLFPGDVVAMKAAHQMQMAIKNESGGGVDPHAGHSH